MVPASQGLGLVLAHDQVELRTLILCLQFMERIDGVGGATAPRFTVIDHGSIDNGKGQAAHFQAVFCGCQQTLLVPGKAGGNHVQNIQAELLKRSLRHGHMGSMRRIEGATKQADFPCLQTAHTQSRRGKKSLYSAASGVPVCGTFWYDQLACGGMDSKIDSVRPPDCRPKCVPRSHTRLNST